MTRKEFEYGGKHFIPIRKFNARDGDFHKVVRNLRTDRELGFYAGNYNDCQKYPYNYDDFYKAYGSDDCDVFKCKENGKEYVPCKFELQQYLPKNQDLER